ncbi:MAG: serine hydrolase domain-containing protein, partial [Alphaproteobacteria bacterium]
MKSTFMNRRALLAGAVAGVAGVMPARPAWAQAHPAMPASEQADMDGIVAQARSFAALHTMLVSRQGNILIERTFRGPAGERAVNVKSVSKTIIATLVGIAIERKVLTGLEQPIAPLLAGSLPPNADPRLQRVTIGNLLSMQAGLERTSGPNYGRWVESGNWVRYALSRDFVDEPGGRMLYSTGNSHLLSAILTRATGRSTLRNARDWLGKPLDIDIPAWPRDPQGIYFGGNDMELSPRAMLAFGTLFLHAGRNGERQIVPKQWIDASWEPRTSSPFTGDAYGLGWFITQTPNGDPIHYA